MIGMLGLQPQDSSGPVFSYKLPYIVTCIMTTMLLPAAQVRGSLGAGILEKYYVSPLSALGHCGINVVSFGKALYL